MNIGRTFRHPSPQARVRAFTLIELIISASLMTIILVAAYLCLTSSVLSQKLIDSRADVVQGARVAMAMIAADLRSATPLHTDFAFLGMSANIDDVEADNLDFATHNFTPRRPGEGDWGEVSYFVARSEAAEGLSLWRRRDSGIDEDPLGGGTREEIVSGLVGLRLEYYDGFEWFDDWGDIDGKAKAQNSLRPAPNLVGMPEAVRVTLWLEPRDRSGKAAENPEPPLVFETICRLNLAGVSASAGLTGSSTGNTPNDGNETMEIPPQGGNQ